MQPQSMPIVTHPELGTGRLLRTHVGGYVWEVEFANGRRFRLPAREFSQESLDAQEAPVRARPLVRLRKMPEMEQFTARQTIETLRFGIVPRADIETLTIGLETEQTSLVRALERTTTQGGDALCIMGDYGYGKSHFIEFAAARAKRENMLVMKASLDLQETPPGNARQIYIALVNNIHYPDDETDHTLRTLFQKALDAPQVLREFESLCPRDALMCPLMVALHVMRDSGSQRAYEEALNYISGQKPQKDILHPFVDKLPNLYANGPMARQYTYLLTGISVLAKLCGYAGLAVLIDESELYSQLKNKQIERADEFFRAMIYAAVGTNKGRLVEEDIPQDQRAPYDIVFAPNAGLLFAFAVTIDPEHMMPVDDWLAPSQQIRLDDNYLPKDILEFFKMLLQYHRHAYGYETPPERYREVILQASQHVSEALRDRRYNIRLAIKAVVEVCDLLFLYPDYRPADLLHEMAHSA